MDFQKFVEEALKLPEEQRAALLQSLILSLGRPDSSTLRDEWLREASRRANELDQGTVTPLSGDEVMRKARALVK